MPAFIESNKDMVYRGETPWHGMGELVNSIDSLPAILDWLVLCMQLWLHGRTENRVVEGFKALIRSTDGFQLSVVGADYKPHQNRDFWFKVLLPYVEAAQLIVETAGMLKGGRVVWFLCKVPGATYDAGKGDKSQLYMLIGTSHDGSLRTFCIPTTVRVVCWNTLMVALMGALGFRQKHTSELNVNGARAEIEKAIEAFQMEGEIAARLKATPVNGTVIRSFVAELIQPELIELNLPNRGDKYAGRTVNQLLDFTADAMVVERNFHDKANRTVNDILRTIPKQAGGFDGSLYGLVNAVTFRADHTAGRSQDTRLSSAWFGPNAKLKADAFKLADDYSRKLAA